MDEANHPRRLLETAPLSLRQKVVILLCVLINIIDGYDILASAFTAPAIAGAMGLDNIQLGVFFSAGPAGMIVGALFLSPLADIAGRRIAVLTCLLVVTLGMATTALAPDLTVLLVGRALAGIGVGAMMAAINTVVAEVVNQRFRDLAIAVQAAGFPLGGALGGLIFYQFGDADWRLAFYGGALLSALLIPAVLWGLPESLDFLIERRPHRALERVNRVLEQFRHAPVDRLPEPEAKSSGKSPVAALVATSEAGSICASFFLLMMVFYFLSNWLPKIIADGAASLGSGVSGAIMLSLGGVAGDLAFAALALRWSAPVLTRIFAQACFASTVLFVIIGQLWGLVLVPALVLGFFLYGTMAGHYAVVPRVFPAIVRTSGTGLALGTGRVGATLGPLLGGVLLAAASASWSVILMTLPLLGCAYLIARIGRGLPPKI